MTGPTLRFHRDALISLCGAAMSATVDGQAIGPWQATQVAAGSVLKIGTAGPGGGSRAYLAVRGGIDVPAYLGSRSTFTLGQFGGHGGRTLRAGDMVHIGEQAQAPACPAAA